MARKAEGEARHIPCSTYRLQLSRFFTFSQTAAVLNYLHNLGIWDCYTLHSATTVSRNHWSVPISAGHRFGGGAGSAAGALKVVLAELGGWGALLKWSRTRQLTSVGGNRQRAHSLGYLN